MRTLRYASLGFLVGVAWGVVARVWMRLISTSPEFSWAGTLGIFAATGICGLALGVIHAARRRAQGSLFDPCGHEDVGGGVLGAELQCLVAVRRGQGAHGRLGPQHGYSLPVASEVVDRWRNASPDRYPRPRRFTP